MNRTPGDRPRRHPRHHDRRFSGARGQVLVVFALLSLFIFVTIGLALDAGFAYMRSDAQDRAAGAAALSGLPYLPGDMRMATIMAYEEAARNGYNPFTNPAVTVSITQPPNTQTQLRVTISDSVPVSFLRLLGLGSTKVTRAETADFMPALTLGQGGASLGSSLSQLGTNGNYYFMRQSGLGGYRSHGDAFTPDPTYDTSYAAVPPDIHALSRVRRTEDQYAGLPDNGGYNYLLYVPAGQLADLQVYNPGYAPSSDAYVETNDVPPGGTHSGGNSWTDNSWYSGTKYTFFAASGPQYHLGETVLGQALYRPIDGHTSCNGATCNGYGYFDPANGKYKTEPNASPAAYHAWISVGSFAPGGTDGKLVNLTTALPSAGALSGGATGRYYRLRVDSVNWDGSVGTNPDTSSAGNHAYALRLTAFGTSNPCAACILSALNDICIYTPVDHASFQLPFVNVPDDYAGRTFTVNLFDTGDVNSSSADISVIQPAYQGHPPATASATAIYDTGPQLGGPRSSWAAVTPTPPGKAAFQADDASGNHLYNGHWIQIQVSVPSDYKQLTGKPYWMLQYGIPSGTAADTITISIQSTGSPVHLLP